MVDTEEMVRVGASRHLRRLAHLATHVAFLLSQNLERAEMFDDGLETGFNVIIVPNFRQQQTVRLQRLP